MGVGTRSRTRTWQSQPFRGQDIEQEVEISLEEAFHGTTRLLQMDGRRLEVKIPPGVRTGSKVRISGAGSPGVGGGPSGNLYLKIKVAPHPVFRRDGDDLYCEVPVDLYTAILGGEAKVPTLKGSVMLKIPPETQNGKTFRLRGQGMPTLKDPARRGDLFATVHVRLPQRLSDKERELFRELAQLRRG
jgi:curved DNA-binding protein